MFRVCVHTACPAMDPVMENRGAGECFMVKLAEMEVTAE
jgi:hypothetical protein